MTEIIIPVIPFIILIILAIPSALFIFVMVVIGITALVWKMVAFIVGKAFKEKNEEEQEEAPYKVEREDE